MLHRRGWFHFTGRLASRIGRQLIATAAMSALLWWLTDMLAERRYGGSSVLERRLVARGAGRRRDLRSMLRRLANRIAVGRSDKI